MQQQSGRRVLALVAALAFGAVGSAVAQDTTSVGRARMDTTQPAAGAIDTTQTDTSAVRDTTDTSGVTNQQGYRGMEQDTIQGSTGDSLGDTTRIPAQRTSSDSFRSDTAAAGEDGGKTTERPAAADSSDNDTSQ